MKTKIFLFIISLLFIITNGCKKEGTPSIKLSLDNSHPYNSGDTLRCEIAFENCVQNPQITFWIADIQLKTISAEIGNTVDLIIPSMDEGWYPIIAKHPIGCTSQKEIGIWNKLRIKSFYPTNGKAGDEIQVKGFDFISPTHQTIFVINTLYCDIKSITDTSAIIIVPEGCGSGKIKARLLSFQNDPYTYWQEGKSSQIFTYNFEFKEQLITKYFENGATFNISRDAQKRVKSVNSRTFVYGSDGLIDTIYSGMNSFKTFERDYNSSLIEERLFQIQGGLPVFDYNIEYHYLLGVPKSEFTYYQKTSGNELYMYSAKYYENYANDVINDKLFIYNEDGTTYEERNTSKELDIYNKPLNIGIPGYPYSYKYNVSQGRFLTYNQYGNLEKVEIMDGGQKKIELIYYYE